MTPKIASVVAAFALVAVGATVLFELAPGDGAARSDQPRSSDPTPISPPPFPAARRPTGEADDPHAEEARLAQLGFPAPRRFRPASPERVVAEWMQAWRDRHFQRMSLWTTPAWRNRVDEKGVGMLRRAYGDRRVRGWTITRRSRGKDGPGSARLEVLVAYRTQLDPRPRRDDVTFLLERQSADGTRAPETGRWGVKPVPAPTVSLAR